MQRRLAILLGGVMLLSGCLFRDRGPALPVDNSVTRDQLVIYSDFKLPSRHRLINELVALRGDLAAKLKLPMSEEPIHVYLFKTVRDYREFMKSRYPDFVDRRAFFVKTDTTLSVYAYWGDRVAEDLRHEVAHGYLHSAVANLPLWMDEGLAEYFEVPKGMRGVNRQHAELLMKKYDKDQWTPNLPRVEQLNDAVEMTQTDYAESWLWVHLLLESSDERRELVQQHVAKLKEGSEVVPFSQLLAQQESSTERVLIQHLKSMADESQK